MSEILPHNQAILTERDYCCAICWSHLLLRPAEGHAWSVECAVYGDEHNGFVTKFYADSRRSASIGEIIEINQMLREINVLPKSGRTTQQLLTELGF